MSPSGLQCTGEAAGEKRRMKLAAGTSMATPHLAGLLLAGAVRSGGTVSGDPDGNADTIGVH